MNPSVQLVAGFEKALCEPVTIDHGAFAQHSVKPNFIIEAKNGSLSLPVVFGKHQEALIACEDGYLPHPEKMKCPEIRGLAINKVTKFLEGDLGVREWENVAKCVPTYTFLQEHQTLTTNVDAEFQRFKSTYNENAKNCATDIDGFDTVCGYALNDSYFRLGSNAKATFDECKTTCQSMEECTGFAHIEAGKQYEGCWLKKAHPDGEKYGTDTFRGKDFFAFDGLTTYIKSGLTVPRYVRSALNRAGTYTELLDDDCASDMNGFDKRCGQEIKNPKSKRIVDSVDDCANRCQSDIECAGFSFSFDKTKGVGVCYSGGYTIGASGFEAQAGMKEGSVVYTKNGTAALDGMQHYATVTHPAKRDELQNMSKEKWKALDELYGEACVAKMKKGETCDKEWYSSTRSKKDLVQSIVENQMKTIGDAYEYLAMASWLFEGHSDCQQNFVNKRNMMEGYTSSPLYDVFGVKTCMTPEIVSALKATTADHCKNGPSKQCQQTMRSLCYTTDNIRCRNWHDPAYLPKSLVPAFEEQATEHCKRGATKECRTAMKDLCRIVQSDWEVCDRWHEPTLVGDETNLCNFGDKEGLEECTANIAWKQSPQCKQGPEQYSKACVEEYKQILEKVAPTNRYCTKEHGSAELCLNRLQIEHCYDRQKNCTAVAMKQLASEWDWEGKGPTHCKNLYYSMMNGNVAEEAMLGCTVVIADQTDFFESCNMQDDECQPLFFDHVYRLSNVDPKKDLYDTIVDLGTCLYKGEEDSCMEPSIKFYAILNSIQELEPCLDDQYEPKCKTALNAYIDCDEVLKARDLPAKQVKFVENVCQSIKNPE